MGNALYIGDSVYQNNNLIKPTKKYPLADNSKTTLYADKKDPKKPKL
jgi:hypothetical protein